MQTIQQAFQFIAASSLAGLLLLGGLTGCEVPNQAGAPRNNPGLRARQAPPAPAPKVALTARKLAPRPSGPPWAYILRSWERSGTQPDARGQLIQTFIIKMESLEFPDPRLFKLNQTIRSYVDQIKTDFVQGASNLDDKTLASGRFPWLLVMKFTLVHSGEKLISLLFEVSHLAGGGNGETYFYTINFDPELQQELTINDLLSNPSALTTLSGLVIQTLKQRQEVLTDDALIMSGAGPEPENYRNFTLSKDRLAIYFLPNQVSHYAAGSKPIEIPWRDIQPLLSLRWAAWFTQEGSPSIIPVQNSP